MKTKNLLITPKTKILELIETYPQLEEILISYIPAFNKLKNPILRKTVAKIATLQQVAAIGNVNVEDLINLLRKHVGQDLISVEKDSNYVTVKPDWFDESKIVKEFDVRELLKAGEHPINQVISDLNQLKENEILKVIAPFLPAPMIDKSLSLNFKHWVKKEKEDFFVIYFQKSN